MEVLVLDGKNYVKASKAARDLGYATDYVGQLCRSGKVDAHLIGRTWYVNQDKLGTHRVEKKRMSRVKAREQAKRSIEEQRQKTSETKNSYKNIEIQYEEDHKELIPETRKLTVESVLYKGQNQNVEESQDTYIENKGEKIVLSGELNVVDVTDSPLESDTIILTPSKIKRGKRDKEKLLPEAPESTETDADFESTEPAVNKDIPQVLNFTEKLEAKYRESKEIDANSPVTLEKEMVIALGEPQQSLVSVLLIVLLILLLTAMTVPLSLNIEYSSEYPNHLEKTYHFSITETLELFSSKI